MYPNSSGNSVSGGGAAPQYSKVADMHNAKLKEIATRNGATQYKTDDSGATIFYNDAGQVVGETKGYDGNGNIFGTAATQSSSPTINQSQMQQQISSQTNIGNLLNGGGNFNSGSDLSSSWMNAGYDIDTNKIMKSTGILSAITGLTSLIAENKWFGNLAGLFGSNATSFAAQSFINAANFKFDFSSRFVSSQGQQENSNSDIKTDSASVPTGYVAVTGKNDLYVKGDKYLKYDKTSNTCKECDANGNIIPDKSDNANNANNADNASKPEASAGTTTVTESPASSEKPASETKISETKPDKDVSGVSKKSGTGSVSKSTRKKVADKKGADKAEPKTTKNKNVNNDPRPNLPDYSTFVHNSRNLSIGIKSDTADKDGNRTVVLQNGQKYVFDNKGRMTNRNGITLSYKGDETRPSVETKSSASTKVLGTTSYGTPMSTTTTKSVETRYDKRQNNFSSFEQQKADFNRRGAEYSYSRDEKTGQYTIKTKNNTIVYDKNGKFISDTYKVDGDTTRIRKFQGEYLVTQTTKKTTKTV